jgi:hypothetical protein
VGHFLDVARRAPTQRTLRSCSLHRPTAGRAVPPRVVRPRPSPPRAPRTTRHHED